MKLSPDEIQQCAVATQREEFTPTESWRASFEKQANGRTLEKLYRIARARLGAYSGGRSNVHDDDVDDVVIAALGDTWSGVLTWDPTAKTLFAHLKDAIKYRVRNEAKLSRKRRKHDEIDEDERGETFAGQIAAGAVVPTVESTDVRNELLSEVVDGVLFRLRPHASDDPDVSALLDALAKRIVDRNDVLEETGMNAPELNNSWRRLGRMVRELPAQLRDDALAALS
ncbi:MAG: hypothetical protein AB7T06_37500 [Kofleriaceae bacterium]